jgi:hypothetical protein
MTPQKLRKRNVPIDVKQKQRAAIEVLFLEGQAGEEIAIRSHDLCGQAAYSRPPIFRARHWVRREERRASTRETARETASISETTRSPHGE